jgi:translation initiation factor 2-alpha kinase 4
MYSLGIILFEMCYKLNLGMERAAVLTALRSPAMIFPEKWPDSKVKEKEIISWLLRHDPNLRPTAAQVLTSPLLPSPDKQKEYYDTAIAGG